ncbi:MAG: DUF2971 domain-containing protein [Opitutaceae bacterium]
MSVRIVDWGGELPDNEPLWRYMKLSTFLLLLEGKAFFPSVATLRREDPLECVCDADMSWLQYELPRDLARYKKLQAWLDAWLKKHGPGHVPSRPLYHYEEHYIEMLRELRAIWCWHNSEAESAAMWSIYGERGVAVKTDVASLKAALRAGDFLIARIRYIKRDSDAPSFWTEWDRSRDRELVLRPYLIKSAEYAHESEVRVVTFCPPRTSGWLISDIDVSALIKGVVVSRSVPHEEFCSIERLLKTRTGAPMRRSTLLGHLIEEQQTHAIAAGYFSNQPARVEPDYLHEL